MESCWRRLVVAVTIVSLGGCSLALSGPDPERAAGSPPRCDTGKGLVGLDGVIGAGFAVGALGALASGEGEAAAITGLISVAFIAAASRGSNVVNDCRREMASYSPGYSGEPVARQPSRPEDPYGAVPRRVMAPRPAPVDASRAEPRPLPAVVTPARAATPAPAPVPASAPEPGDEWTDFWKELP